MLPQTSPNYEHFDFSTSFSKNFTMPTINQIGIILALTQMCFFLVRLNVYRLDVRLFNVTSFPSRKQAQGFKVCPTAQLRDSIPGSNSLQTGLTHELGLAARTGAGHCEGCREGDNNHPEELCPWKGRGLCHSLLLHGV